MNKFFICLLASLVFISTLAGCGTDSLYYSYDLSDYISVGEYSNEVDRNSADYKSAKTNFYSITFGTDLQSEVKEGKVQEGDIANINYKGMKDGVAFDGGTAENYDLTIGSGQFIPGFEDGLIGAAIGETVNLDLKFPESYGSKDLAGQAVVFEVKVNYVTRSGEPTETNVKRYGFASLEDYNKQADEYAVGVCMLYNIYDATEIKTYPEKEVKVLYDNTIKYFEDYCASNSITLEYFAQANGMTLDSFRQYIEENEVKGSMKIYLVAYHALKANGEKLTQADVDAKREELTKKYKETLETIGYFEINIEQGAAYDKAIKILAPMATVKN